MSTPVTVRTPAGTITGRRHGDVRRFLGIPYAEAPTGPRRFAAPLPRGRFIQPYDASRPGATAQRVPLFATTTIPEPSVPGDDILNVSVTAPDADGCPVLVWIHGGGFVSGSGSLPNYSGETFARDGDFVVVSVNYRIGPLGYLYTGPEEGNPEGAGNPWLSDQLAALRWVAAHIASFGGDPENVTVAGQSGGALSTAALAGLPETQGLIRRVILQSPPFGLDLPGPDAYLERTAAYLELAGVKTVAELRELPWPELIGAAGGLFARTTRWGYWPTPFLPVIDGVTLTRHPVEALLHGAATGVDVMIGWTREEANFGFALDAGYAAAGREQVTARIAETFGAEAAPGVYAAYERARPGARPVDVLMDLITDELFRVPAVRLAEARAESGPPVWAYQFDLPTPAHEGRLGAAHCLELPFVFDNFDRWAHAPFLAGIDPAVRDGLAHTMHQAWIAFARTGDPNHPAMPTWEPYGTDTRTTMRFDAVVTALGDLAGDSRRLHGPVARGLPS